MASVSKASSSTGKGTHKKSGTSKSRKHTKSTSSDNQEELKRVNDAPKVKYSYKNVIIIYFQSFIV